MTAATLLLLSTSMAVGGQVASAQQSGTGVSPATMPESSTALRIGTWAWGSTYSNNPYSPSGTVQINGFALMGLAVYSDLPRPGPNPYYPELATSWHTTKTSITLQLRKSAKWQNGKPFTSSDVMTSLLLAGANYNSIWGSIANVQTPTPHEVRINLKSWAVAPVVLTQLWQVTILPTSQYGHLLPSNFEQDLVSYWREYNVLHPTRLSIQDSASSAAGKALKSTDAKLAGYNPSKLIGNGPYKLDHATVGGDLYEKWSGWWDAKAITVPWVEIVPMTQATMFGEDLSGRIDFEQATGFTDPQKVQLDNSTTGHYVFEPAPTQVISLVFNTHDYPFNLLAVRKALAYAIDRPRVAKLDGYAQQDTATKNEMGINDIEASDYLTAKQINSLQPYNYSPTKATTLLRSVGFTKRDGTWYTAEGKPFTFTIAEQAGFTRFDVDGVVMSRMLKAFGIDATTTDINASTYASQEEQGDFSVSANFMNWGLGSPIADFAATFGGSAWNYPVWYKGKGSCDCRPAIGIGPTAKVPGLGKVDIAAALNEEVNSAQPNTWRSYTYDWARYMDQQLPILPYENDHFQESYTSSRYTDFPPITKRWMWTFFAGTAQPVLWQQEGYLKLKNS